MELTIVTRPEPPHGFLAYTVEHFFAASGPTKDEAVARLRDVLEGQAFLDNAAGREPLTWVPPAPPHLVPSVG